MDNTKKNVLYTRQSSAWFKGLAIIMVVLSHYAEWWAWFYTEEGISEIIRFAISRFGPYGVAIFFLFSGYGLTKSAGDVRIGGRFIVKRITSVYIPYLVLVVIMELLSGGFSSVEDVLKIFYGQNFWYMTVLFSFYLAFMAIWLFAANKHIRAILMVVFTYGYSYYLYRTGEQDFWYISNIAFAIGVLFALYEPVVKKIMEKAGVVLAILFAAGSVCVVYFALFVEHVWQTPVDEMNSRIIAVVVFTLFIASFATVWKWYGPIFPLFGKVSLYIYLLHTFLFMWAINAFEYEMSVRFAIATGVIVVIPLVVGEVMERLLKIVLKKLV